MKRHLKKVISLKHWIAYLRRQPKHMQHVSAAIFAGTITAIIASIILYTDYGFWHDRYQRADDLIVVSSTTPADVVPESPGEMWSRFWNEAHTQFGSIGSSSVDLLKGKETYSKENNQ